MEPHGYSDKSGRLYTLQMMQEEYKYSKDIIYRLAEEAGAIIRVGRTTRFNPRKFEDLLEKKYTNNKVTFCRKHKRQGI